MMSFRFWWWDFTMERFVALICRLSELECLLSLHSSSSFSSATINYAKLGGIGDQYDTFGDFLHSSSSSSTTMPNSCGVMLWISVHWYDVQDRVYGCISFTIQCITIIWPGACYLACITSEIQLESWTKGMFNFLPQILVLLLWSKWPPFSPCHDGLNPIVFDFEERRQLLWFSEICYSHCNSASHCFYKYYVWTATNYKLGITQPMLAHTNQKMQG